MFYSHQLLARKAPLGQIWLAATTHAKIHRRKLDKLNIIKICEEILNPSVPMALRLSGILMGGVVIVYERKVKLLYDDVNRLLAEINEAWKVKSAPSDPTLLPKGKSHAKYEAVTLPQNHYEDLGDGIEESLPFTVADFQQNSYITMRLDNMDEHYLNQNVQDDLREDRHQVDAANITLIDNYDYFQADATAFAFNRFERFDIEEEHEGTQMNFTPPEHSEIPTLIPSPPRPEEPHNADIFQEKHPEEQNKQQSEESKEANLDNVRQRVAQRRGKRPAAPKMDYDQTIIPGPIYQSWLQDASDIVRRRGKKGKQTINALSKMKTATLTDLPSIVLVDKLFTNGNGQVYYPAPLLEDWFKITKPPRDSPSGRTSNPEPPEPSLSSPPEMMHFMEPMGGDPSEDFHIRVASQSKGISIEKQMAKGNNDYEMPPEMQMDELRNNLRSNGWGVKEANGVNASKANVMGTPGNSGDEIRSIPGSGSDHGFFSQNSDINSGRSSRKRPFSASKNSGNGLEPVAEEFPSQHPDPSFKLSRRSENDNDLLVETGPSQTPIHPIVNQPLDQITNSIRTHLKTHFDAPGSAKEESLNQLALGMTRKGAASLFYQTCVLATRDDIKVDQKLPYGDILISRGANM